jgi:flagellar protein FlgJ
MNIGGVSDKLVGNTIDNTKTRAAGDEFERRLKAAMETKDDKELKKVCQEFESIMLTMMYKQMKATVPKSGLMPESTGRDIMESMLDEKLIEKASESKGAGLGDVLYKQLSKRLNPTYKP